MTNITEIFPTYLANYKSNINLDTVLDECFQMEKENDGVKISNVGGWQSDLIDLNSKPFDALVPEILKTLQTVIEYTKLKPYYTIRNAWININRANCSNLVHMHPESSIGGVFYIKVPENSGKIKFLNPARIGITSNVSDDQWVAKPFHRPITEVYEYLPVPGEVLMFPSWLEHYVENNDNVNNEPRVSIAFNIKINSR